VKKSRKQSQKKKAFIKSEFKIFDISLGRRSYKNLYKNLSFCWLLTDFVSLIFVIQVRDRKTYEIRKYLLNLKTFCD